MKLLMRFFQVFIRNMGVDLGGGDGRVSEHSLHASDIRTILEEVGGETVTQGMRVDIFHDSALVA